jgi:hypothetical protein
VGLIEVCGNLEEREVKYLSNLCVRPSAFAKDAKQRAPALLVKGVLVVGFGDLNTPIEEPVRYICLEVGAEDTSDS